VNERFYQISRSGALLLLLCFVAGCDGPFGPLDLNEDARLVVEAQLAGTSASALVLEVTAPDIPVPLVFNLPVRDGTASGAVTLPAGVDRQLTARAFDTRGAQTHSGSRKLHVRAGGNETASLTLLPLMGDQPIVVTVGSYRVTVSPGEATLAPGEAVQLAARVTDADGAVVADATVQWASLHPEKATVTSGGVATAHASGRAQLVAVFAGAGGGAWLTIEP